MLSPYFSSSMLIYVWDEKVQPLFWSVELYLIDWRKFSRGHSSRKNLRRVGGKIWPQKLEVITAKYSASDLQRHTVFGFYWIFLTEEGRRFSVNGLDWGLSGRMENMTLQTTHAEEMSDVLSIAKVRFESGLFPYGDYLRMHLISVSTKFPCNMRLICFHF